jgi:hypothetical protein
MKREFCSLVDVYLHPTAVFQVQNLSTFMYVCINIYKTKECIFLYYGGLPICHKPICKIVQLLFYYFTKYIFEYIL